LKDFILPNSVSDKRLLIIASPGGLFGGGGMGTVSRTIKECAVNSGSDYEVRIIDPRGEGHISKSVFYFPYALLQLFAYRLSLGSGILHLQVSERTSFIRKLCLCLLGKGLGMKVVLHHHGAELIQYIEGSSGLIKQVNDLAVKQADANVVLGEIWQEFLIDTYRLDPDTVHVIRNGVPDLGGKLSEKRSAYLKDKDPNSHRLLLLANLSERKGVSDLLQAVSKVVSQGYDVELNCVGGGDIATYKAKAKSMGLEDRVKFAGWTERDGVEDFIASSDIFVLPSYDEGLPMSILESMSAELPVIATPVGAIPEVFQDRKDILLVEPGQPDDLATAIVSLIDDAALRGKIAAGGRWLYCDRYTDEAFYRRIEQIYKRLG
jgi:glycosyltransferase involved in cell wall biosynthesis